MAVERVAKIRIGTGMNVWRHALDRPLAPDRIDTSLDYSSKTRSRPFVRQYIVAIQLAHFTSRQRVAFSKATLIRYDDFEGDGLRNS